MRIAVLEGDRIKVIDERASGMPDCPHLLDALLRFDAQGSAVSADNAWTFDEKSSSFIAPAKAGTYAFFCGVHGKGMSGTLTVATWVKGMAEP